MVMIASILYLRTSFIRTKNTINLSTLRTNASRIGPLTNAHYIMFVIRWQVILTCLSYEIDIL